MLFYDTNALLELQNKIFQNQFLISVITLKELENIKVSANKDSDVKYKARNILRLLRDNSGAYEAVQFDCESRLEDYPVLSNNNDSRIILTALKEHEKRGDIIFITGDLSCYMIAKTLLPCQFLEINNKDNYTGFKEIALNSEGLADFYVNTLANNSNLYNLNLNEYLIIQDSSGNAIDQYKWTKKGYQFVGFNCCSSRMFGQIKPKDIYQRLAIDSMYNNQITLLGGPAGSGKSYLSFGYLFSELERGHIDKIIIFVNPAAAKNAVKLGFYPGSAQEKILSTQAGHVLSSKIGSMIEVEKLLNEEKLQLIPVADARGYQVPPNCAIYILEAQNLTSDLMRLILQRTSEDTKIIIDGDAEEQLDMDIYASDNGIYKLSEVFRGTDLYGQVNLQKIYRSKIASIAEKMK